VTAAALIKRANACQFSQSRAWLRTSDRNALLLSPEDSKERVRFSAVILFVR
jgi:hypothetical protein